MWKGTQHTLVLRVRLTTVPALIMRSNSKQPFWLTGDMRPAPALVVVVKVSIRIGRIAIGLTPTGVGWGLSANVAAMAARGVFYDGGQCIRRGLGDAKWRRVEV